MAHFPLSQDYRYGFRTKTLILAATILTVIFTSCKEESATETIIERRRTLQDYNWTIDSIYYAGGPHNPMELTGMWGSSPSDVWGVAGDSDPNDALWHLDKYGWWRRATGNTIFTNYTGYRAVYDVWGSSATDVWAVGFRIFSGVAGAMIVHYDGQAWTDVTPPHVRAIDATLYTIHASSRNDIWAAGYEYAIHFNGAQWDTFKVADSMIVRSMTGQGNDIYLTAYSPWGKDLLQLYHLSNGVPQLIEQTSKYFSKFGASLWLHDSTITSLGYNIYSNSLRSDGTVDTSGWRKIYDTGQKGIASFYVLSPTNVVAVGSVYLVLQYDQGAWREINIRGQNDPGNTLSSLCALWTDGDEYFISNYHDGFVYHGK